LHRRIQSAHFAQERLERDQSLVQSRLQALGLVAFPVRPVAHGVGHPFRHGAAVPSRARGDAPPVDGNHEFIVLFHDGFREMRERTVFDRHRLKKRLQSQMLGHRLLRQPGFAQPALAGFAPGREP